MASLNQLQLIGRLGKNPEMSYTPNGKAYTYFSLAVDQGYGENRKTMWINVTCWDKLAERMNEWLYSGCLVYVQGHLSVEQYTPKGSTDKRVSVKCVAAMVEVLSSKNERAGKEVVTEEEGPYDGEGVPF